MIANTAIGIALANVLLLLILWIGRRIEKDAPAPAVPLAELPAATAWYPPEVKPERVGEYRVRMPWKTITAIQMARWDGALWRDLTTGRECYFQQLAWQGLTEPVAG
jgi:hypothetical protein